MRGSSRGRLAALAHEPIEEINDPTSVAMGDGVVEKGLPGHGRQRIVRAQPAMPSRIAIDLAIVGNGARHLVIKPAPGLDRQAPLQLGVLLIESLDMRRHRMEAALCVTSINSGP
jgi:hypothetical protein